MGEKTIVERLINQNKYLVIFIIALTLVITYLHYSTLPGIHDLHNIFTELYYLPLLLGALAFGLKGAVLTFIFIAVLYVPFVIISWSATYLFVANKLLHALISVSFAILAGVIVDREKRHRQQLEKDRYLTSLGQAATAIVHDLKNPIITISGFARRIQEGKGDAKSASQAILSSIQSMQMIVNDVLDFAKPIKLAFNEEDMRSVINKACDSCKTKAEDKEVDLSVSLPSDAVITSIDRFKMERALVNLINNAIDASLIGHNVLITTATEKESLVIRTKDYGEGMDRETVENVFIPFYTKKVSAPDSEWLLQKRLSKLIMEVFILKVSRNLGQRL
jgi:signal transduction histidine kinase